MLAGHVLEQAASRSGIGAPRAPLREERRRLALAPEAGLAAPESLSTMPAARRRPGGGSIVPLTDYLRQVPNLDEVATRLWTEPGCVMTSSARLKRMLRARVQGAGWPGHEVVIEKISLLRLPG